MANILLLEPDNLLAGKIKTYFANAKHTVSVHSDPQQAIAQADINRPDVVITDLQLAGRSGVEFLYEFRSYPDWQEIPVIVTSNLHNDETNAYTEVFDELNVVTCIYKPSASMERLLKTVNDCLKPIHAKV